MRSIALSVCTFALIACSSNGTSQLSTPAAGGSASQTVISADGGNAGQPSGPAAGGKKTPPGQSGDPKGGGVGGSGADGGALVNSGCTYTQGYWKNHSSAWPVTSLTIGGVSYSEQQLLDIFNTPPKGDASIILAHQLITALLNTADGAAPSAAVQQAIDDAQAWMTANRGSNAGLPYGVSAGSAAGQQATALTDTLDNFNSDHCGGGGSSGSSGSGSSGTGSSGSGASCGPGGTPCSGPSSQCFEGMECVDGCCVTPPPTPPTNPTPPTLPTLPTIR